MKSYLIKIIALVLIAPQVIGTKIQAEKASEDLVITEIMNDPNTIADTNQDGASSSSNDEFVEIYNNSSDSIDISGWRLSDAALIRHIFPANTVVAGNCSIVIFGGGVIPGDYGSSLAQIASAGALGLNNGGDTVTLDDGVDIVTTTSIGSGTAGISFARDPEFTGNFVLHDTLNAGANNFSPGKKNDGTNYEGCPDLIFNEMLSNPGTIADSNLDGVSSSTDDEFVEIYNNSSIKIDISGWTFSDANTERHIFPADTVIPGNCALILFGGGVVIEEGEQNQLRGYAVAQKASSGFIALNNGGDTVLLKNGDTIMAQETFGSSTSGISFTRDPDTTGGFVLHNSAIGAVSNFSAGYKSDGINFDGCNDILFMDSFEDVN